MKKILFAFLCCFSLSILPGLADKFVIVIDAGHGGKDTGAIRGSHKEKDINLGVALALGNLIEDNMKDVKVVYTRKSDTFVDLYKRAQIANKAKANLFVSVHTNSTAAKITTAQGADTYILGLARSEENLAVAKRENAVILLEDNYNKRYEGFDPNSPESNIIFEFMTDKYMEQSLQFATLVQKGFLNVAHRKDRGVRQAGFLVLRESAMPSVLIELGFINNPIEAKYLVSNVGQRSMASAIYSGIEKYKNDFNKKQGKIIVDNDNKPKQQPETIIQEEVPAITIQKKPKNVVSEDTPAPKPQVTEKQPKVQVITKVKETTVREKIESNNQIEYRVQFLISSKKLPPAASAFKGLTPIQEYKDGNIYKYTYGAVPTEQEAIHIRNQIKSKFKDAFVIQFKNGIRVK